MPRRNVSLGLLLGVVMAVVYSIAGGIGYLAAPVTNADGIPVSFSAIVATYFIGGITAGVIVGYLLPFTARAWGAMLVGVIAVFPFFLAVGISVEPPSVHGWSFIVTATATAVFFGAGGGLVL